LPPITELKRIEKNPIKKRRSESDEDNPRRTKIRRLAGDLEAAPPAPSLPSLPRIPNPPKSKRNKSEPKISPKTKNPLHNAQFWVDHDQKAEDERNFFRDPLRQDEFAKTVKRPHVTSYHF
jgi:hypothetical protein